MTSRQRVDPGLDWAHMRKTTYSPAIACDGWVFVSELVATGPNRTILHHDDLLGQTEIVLTSLGKLLRAAGRNYWDVVATREFVVTTDNHKATADLRRRFLPEPYPAATGFAVPQLLRPGALIEMETIAPILDSAR